MLMLFRHVIRDGTVLSFTATQTLMGSDTVLLVKDLDRRIRAPDIDFFTDESVWARVVHKVHSYVIIELDFRLLPGSEFVRGGRQWSQ